MHILNRKKQNDTKQCMHTLPYNTLQYNISNDGGDTTTVKNQLLWALLTYYIHVTYIYLETTINYTGQTSTRVTI